MQEPAQERNLARSLQPVLAIDGPAASGKTTVASELGRQLGLLHISSGIVYRALSQKAIRSGILAEDTESLCAEATLLHLRIDSGVLLVDGRPVEDLDRAAVGEYASRLGTSTDVRTVLTRRLRTLAAGQPVVMDGRDIGTVVFPDARLKYYLDAELAERARRRAAETGAPVEREETEMATRDERDRRRKAAPLQAAPDALVLDTTAMSVGEVVERISTNWLDSACQAIP